MSTMVHDELTTMKFGTDETIQAVCVAMVEHENTDRNVVLYGVTTMADAVTAHHALISADRPQLANRAFRFPGSYFLDAEDAATLFESLSDYALGESVCNTDTHGGYAGDMCACERRDLAWSWASEIAGRSGIELV